MQIHTNTQNLTRNKVGGDFYYNSFKTIIETKYALKTNKSYKIMKKGSKNCKKVIIKLIYDVQTN